ncbi:hypothetical protein Ga0100231_005385 [Opitutaceae bacterium TAV4]|nr:hypothetical protein Ga0100231_005385 [Opitutaceae bacterium TAV4]RRK02596.1 hypothetical protein Ga0100230_005635 [Opitutaceae bacterium TAV3]
MKPAAIAPLVCVVALLFTGCVSGHQSSIWKPWTWGQGTAAAAIEKAETRQATQADALIDAAQVETVKTQAALAAAPESRPVEVARRTSGNAAALLNQRKPISAAAHADALETVRGLLSEETAARETAEQRQRSAEGENARLSRELEDTRKSLEGLHTAAKAEAQRNLELANELRRRTWVAWAGGIASAVLAAAAIAYRLNLGHLQTGVGNALASLQTRYGTSDEDVTAIRSEIDAMASQSMQRGIAAAVGKALARS